MQLLSNKTKINNAPPFFNKITCFYVMNFKIKKLILSIINVKYLVTFIVPIVVTLIQVYKTINIRMKDRATIDTILGFFYQFDFSIASLIKLR